MAIARIQVVAVQHREGVSKASKEPYSMDTCKCVLLDEKGSAVTVGEFTLPKDHPKVTPGQYTPTLEVAATYEGKVVARIASLTPFNPAGAPRA